MIKILLLLSLLASCSIFDLSEPELIEAKTKKVLHAMPKTFSLKNKDLYKRVSCNNCHEKLDKQFTHSAAETSCLSCHLPHNSKPKKKALLRIASQAMCTKCHNVKNIHQRALEIANHPINKKVGCLNCHDPHASETSINLIRYDFGNETKYKGNMCARCHWSKSYDAKKSH